MYLFFDEGGRMGNVFKTKDWSATDLGTVNEWSDSLCLAVNLCLNSNFPIAIYWSEQLNILYNDQYADLLVNDSDSDLGLPCKKIWPEIWNDLEKQFTKVFDTGKAVRKRAQKILINRHGLLEECTMDYSMVPIRDRHGKVVGVWKELLKVLSNDERDENIQKVSKENNEVRKELDTLKESLTLSNEQQQKANTLLNTLNEELKVSQEELSLAIDAANLATWDLNPLTGRFKGNDLLKSWFGLPLDQDIKPEVATEVVADYDRERVIMAIQRAMDYTTGGRYDLYYTITNPINPEPRILRAKGKMYFDENRRPIRFSGVLQDVTEIKQDEQRKNDFIAMVSHELKTPLTSIKAYLQILDRKASKGEDKFTSNILEKSINQIGKMTTLVHGFLNVSRLESGKIEINLERFDLSLLLAEVKEEFLASTKSHHLNFLLIDCNYVHADRDKIGQVINNLISNAIKYSPHGSTIIVDCITKDDKIYLSVKDMGIGISKSDLPKLFERYYRVNTLQSTNISGFGIGLYLCCEIIKRHHGELWAESELGKGSTFIFSLAIIN
jgi:two-component system sensor histidine kinase VicK